MISMMLCLLLNEEETWRKKTYQPVRWLYLFLSEEDTKRTFWEMGCFVLTNVKTEKQLAYEGYD